MTRRVLNFLTVVSLLLCVAVAALWVRSYVAHDMLKVRPGTWLLVLHSFADQGSLMATWTWHSDFNLRPWRARHGS